ncbi:calcium-binding protein [Salisaeta longa]|uniref:calcium-binding protein n=1 Tax=Salisaeta longa TaxID=503170 RepID=UPI0003B46DF2|nr:calcium-binding protein [Salisaeta longa]
MPAQQSNFPFFFPTLLALALLVVFTACDSTPGAIDEEPSAEATTDVNDPDGATAKALGRSQGNTGCGIDNLNSFINNVVLPERNAGSVEGVFSHEIDGVTYNVYDLADPVTVAAMDEETNGAGITFRFTSSDLAVENDIVIGTDDPDNVRSRAGTDCVFGQDGDDFLRADGKNDYIRGGEGNDTIKVTGKGGENEASRLFGDNGNDVIASFQRGILEMHGGDGDDELYGGAFDDYLYGGPGDDVLKSDAVNIHPVSYPAGNDRLVGGPGADNLDGGPGDDHLHGGKGEDILRGGDGDDTLVGHLDADILYGDDGNDQLRGDELGGSPRFADKLFGGDGNDKLWYVGKEDFADATPWTFAEHVSGGSGTDWVRLDNRGTGGKRFYMDRASVERLQGGNGDDIVRANALRTPVRINGGKGNDVLGGSFMPGDVIDGGEGDDRISGNNGEDTLIGGPGDDQMSGDQKSRDFDDRFLYRAGDISNENRKERLGAFSKGDRLVFERADWTILGAKLQGRYGIMIRVESTKGDRGWIFAKEIRRHLTTEDLSTTVGMQAFLERFVAGKVSFAPGGPALL